MESFGVLLIHMSPALVMGTLLLVNLNMRRRKEARRENDDAQRMAVALEVELRSLRDAYEENLALIASGAAMLISTRQAGAVYRSGLVRVLTTLDGRALAPVVSAFAHQQRIEAYLAACTRPRGGHAVQVMPRMTPMQELKRRYVEGCREIDLALAALAPAEEPGVEPMLAARPQAVAAPA